MSNEDGEQQSSMHGVTVTRRKYWPKHRSSIDLLTQSAHAGEAGEGRLSWALNHPLLATLEHEGEVRVRDGTWTSDLGKCLHVIQ